MKPRNQNRTAGHATSQSTLGATRSARSSRHLGSAMAGLSLLCISGSAQGQSVPLGEAQNFAIVSSAGVTNSGGTIVGGNIALSPLITITGFPPGTSGPISFNDTKAQNARADAITAYNTLAGKAFLPANDLTGTDLGGKTLAPGVYHFNTSAALTGDLNLNTLGDPNAVFIFQIGSTLTTSANSKVIVNGLGGNIFWQVGSSATIGVGSQFNGNILAKAAISFDTGASLTNGRAIALNASITLLTNQIFAPAIVLAAQGRFWNGGDPQNGRNWSAANWSPTVDGLDPRVNLGPSPDVVFSVNKNPNGNPKNQNTILDSNQTVSSLTINDPVPVTIGPANTLTLSSTGQVTGLTVNSGAGLVTINSNLVLGNLSQVITVNNAAGLVINGVVGGNNGLTKTGAGRLTLTGASTYTDATVISGGTLQLGNGIAEGSSIASSNSVLISDTPNQVSVLAINLMGGESFTNSVTNNGQIQWIAAGTNRQASTSVFTGTGTMLVTGSGTTELLGTNTFSGGTTIDTVGTVLAGNLTGNTSSAFGSGVLTINNGSFDTLDSKSLTITTGGYVQTGGGLNMHVAGTTPGTFTRFLVNGSTNLSGGTVFVYDGTGSYLPRGGDVQNIIQSTGPLSGEFASNSPFAAFFSPVTGETLFFHQGDTLLYPTLAYDANNANVIWVQDSFAGSPNLNDNQTSVGTVLDSTTSGLINLLVTLPPSSLPGILSLIAPDELTAMFQMGFTAGEMQNTNIKRHLQQARLSAAAPDATSYTPSTTDSKGGIIAGTAIVEEGNRWSVFLEGTSGSVSVDDSPNANGYDLDSEGVTLGADLRVSDRFVVGVLGAYANPTANLVNGGDIDATSYKGAVYATVFQNNFYLDALIGAGKNSYETRRASFGGFAEGETDGWELNTLLNAGYDLNKGNWTISPTASLAYTRVNLDEFTETGSLSPLQFPDQHQESLRSELGVNISYTAALGRIKVTPQVRLAWQHEFLDSTQTMDSRLVSGNGQIFTVSGPQMDRDRAMIGAGVNVQITPTFSVYGYYDGQIGSSDYRADNVTVGMKYDF